VKLSWDTTGGALVVPLRPGMLAGKKAIVFETSDPDGPLEGGTSKLTLEVVDGAGGKATFDVAALVGPGWKIRPRRLSVAYLPLSKVSGVDLSRATAIRILGKGGAAGTSLVDVLRVE
jgi:hypothetical protein